MPAPLGEGPERAPVERVLGAARFEGDLARAPALPFRHALARLGAATRGQAGAAARESLEAFGALRSLVALHGPAEPYNLLVTRDWMLLVPRSCERWEGISVNALGFAGSLLVRDRAELERVRAAGPLTVLRGVALAP